MAVTSYITNRFVDGLGWIPKPELIAYLAGVWCRAPKSAGAYMHSTLLTPGGIPEGSQGEFVYAREPLASRLPSLVASLGGVTCIYGEFDWMNWRNAAVERA